MENDCFKLLLLKVSLQATDFFFSVLSAGVCDRRERNVNIGTSSKFWMYYVRLAFKNRWFMTQIVGRHSPLMLNLLASELTVFALYTSL